MAELQRERRSVAERNGRLAGRRRGHPWTGGANDDRRDAATGRQALALEEPGDGRKGMASPIRGLNGESGTTSPRFPSVATSSVTNG